MAASETLVRANRRNALLSTGPKSDEGRDVVKLNALRHGLRSVQTVVPGESPDDWEGHRAALVDDLKPFGVLELALVEQVAAGLWRLGRVLRFEADAIGVGQSRDEVVNDHEKNRTRSGGICLSKADIPTARDVEKVRTEAKQARAKARELKTAIGQLEGLAALEDEAIIEDWTIYEPLKQSLQLREREADKVFDGDETFRARHLRTMLGMRGTVEQVTEGTLEDWQEQGLPTLKSQAAEARKKFESVRRRYESALDRLAASRGIPDESHLEKITRYESHLWRIVHRGLDRLRELQVARGAAPPKGPAVAVALIQANGQAASGLFGENALGGGGA